jgi:hypothetical protein
LVLAVLGLASSPATVEAKVIWNDPTPLGLHGNLGICHSSPLDRAERLAWRQTLIVQRPGYPFVPSLVTPFGLWVPYAPTGWLWSNRPLGVFASFCDR